jgi:hypothetical protein
VPVALVPLLPLNLYVKARGGETNVITVQAKITK